MRKALRLRGSYDWETHEATRQRNAEQILSIPDPEFPATGTARVSALLAEARRERDKRLLSALRLGRNGWRTETPLDNLIRTTKVTAEHVDEAKVSLGGSGLVDAHQIEMKDEAR